MPLNWPRENAVNPTTECSRWFHPESNYCLDFHGDPAISNLRVFSDGNHHMALEETLESFRSEYNLSSVFYCTTPPKVYLDWMKSESIELGNLRLSVDPDIVIGPDDIMENLLVENRVCRNQVFAQSCGNSFLVLKNNPKNIQQVGDLLRENVRLFISNPMTEKASHMVYRQTLEGIGQKEGIAKQSIEKLLSGDQVHIGELIHHREAPQVIADGLADVAIVYDHLALRYCRIFPEMFDRIKLPADEHNIITRYAIGLANENCQVACSAFRYFLDEKAASIYRNHGLHPVF